MKLRILTTALVGLRSTNLVNTNAGRVAFTLIELVTVIGVIGILSALLLPALAQAKATVQRVSCVSHLKQIGLGVEMYSMDSQEKLPGPLWYGQPFVYDHSSSNTLAYRLQGYLGTPAPCEQVSYSKLFLCPGYQRVAPKAPAGAEQIALIVNRDADPSPTVIAPPFGYPERDGKSTREPLKINSLDSYGSRSTIFALTDAGKENSPGADNPWYAQLPEKPAHGNFRNQLFFDWHVEAKRVR